ncbi:MAG: hypothetical protein KGJ13_13055 [Patescibacteria group bacterium]|nr:hypothetical protein [Patescibacteria group bacterium]
MKLDEAELGRMEELEKAASTGLWMVGNKSIKNPWETVCFDEEFREGDSNFIAASRQFVPAAIAEIRRLRKALEFYALDNRYPGGAGNIITVVEDGGKTTRESLQGEEK